MTEISHSSSTRTGGVKEEIPEEIINGTSTSEKLPASIRAQIERNRQRALMLKQARLIPHPYAKMYMYIIGLQYSFVQISI